MTRVELMRSIIGCNVKHPQTGEIHVVSDYLVRNQLIELWNVSTQTMTYVGLEAYDDMISCDTFY
jgi:hypothetical protein